MNEETKYIVKSIPKAEPNMPTVTGGLRRFLDNQKDLPGADLITRYLRWGPENLETQINVAPDGGDAVEGRRNTWTDGTCSWFHIRVPKGAYDQPFWDDHELRWAPEEHAEAIGSTGWDWNSLCSRWIGFDFDEITSHAKGIGITDDDLLHVQEAAKALDYVEVRLSTGAKGIHLYVLFDETGVPTANHTEHAALARCVLGMMSAEVGFDFASAIDACGSNMWIWHRKLTSTEDGLKLLKAAKRTLSISDLPTNWRDHIAVVTRRANKIKLQGVTDENRDPFNELTSARRIIQLDATHKAIIEALMETGFSTIWVSDHHLLQTHTCALASLMNVAENRSLLNLTGHFQTNSLGKDPGQCNCFLFPLDNGGWRVYRFSPGITEAETWVQDGGGWTTCYFNRLPDIDTACRSYGGKRSEGKPHYVFQNGDDAIKAAEALGQKLNVPLEFRDRTIELRINNGYLTVYLAKDKQDDSKEMKGWIEKRDKWIKDLDKPIRPDDTDDLGNIDYDGFLRTMRSPGGEVAGWMYKTTQGDWSNTAGSNVKLVLQGKGQTKPASEIIMGKCIANPWQFICQPFQDEYPGGRCWNLNAPQLAYVPAQLDNSVIPHHPHWDMILNHVGTELTTALQKHGWARQHGVTTGAQYLLLWIAAIFREPLERAPYLFLHGNEECGKSIFYEAIQLLMTKGVVNASKALVTTGDFNGELIGAILCYVEELDLSHHKVALPRIKDWTMAEYILIRQMRKDAYSLPNTTHWIQVANHRGYCPIFSGDTRITAIQVPDFLPDQAINKDVLKQFLCDEAPHFLYTLLNVIIPPATTERTRIPIIETVSKLDAIDLTLSRLDEFIKLYCRKVKGSQVTTKDFHAALVDWLPHEEEKDWTVKQIGKAVNWKCSHTKESCYFVDMQLINPETTDERVR